MRSRSVHSTASCGSCVSCALADGENAGDRREQAEAGEEEQPGLDAQMREDERRQETTDRDGGLPDPEREPALRGAEPVHHSPAAGRAHARSSGSGQGEKGDEPPKARRVRRRGEEGGAPRQSNSENDPLAEAIGRQPPGEKRERRSHPLGREHEPDLGQRQPVVRANGRRESGQPDPDGGEARLRRRPAGEDDPTVPMLRRCYSPNGLNGLELVETSTLFVSR